MRKSIFPFWRGFSVQLFAVTILPLTLLLLVIAFGSVTLHQRDMRALVGERDERAVQAASAALESELHIEWQVFLDCPPMRSPPKV